MARFNLKHRQAPPPPRSAVRTTGEQRANHQGGTGFVREPKSELFLLAVSNLVSQESFYESGGSRDDRFTALVRELAVTDPQWTLGLLRWLRGEANMRTASLVGAAEFTRARLDAKAAGFSRQAVETVLRRPDEPGELLAYWTARYGRRLPQPLKRGVADAVRRLYTGPALLKYDTAGRGYRFADVLELTHPSPDPRRPGQGELFKYALDRRHHPAEALPPAGDALLCANRELLALPVEQRRAQLTAPDAAERLSAAGLTWEALAGWLQGPLDATAWEAVIPSMGAMALTRNLRNFDQAGVSDAVAERVAAKLSDPGEVRRSRQFPFRYLAAYRHAPSLRWSYPLEQALAHSLRNVPALPGRTLILVDRSGSMFDRPSERSGLNRADSAAIFGTALKVRAGDADLVEFGTGSNVLAVRRGESVLAVLKRFGDLGGTNTAEAVRKHYRGHDRVVIVTDEQTAGGHRGSDPLAAVPEQVPVYTWNLAGYRTGHGPSGGANRHTFGGLSDAAFRLIPLLERGTAAGWPWETGA
ncbi:TROVE domain-containing protein [Kitasatospora sp. NBC_01287]|uniref:TROVE domain-containing protein n=1 Tax=Kitasatospora sp. NBC_01287 TaxID=2903573 RepID=UPI00224E5D06|nr:TROVE domain-containing protein [Kitasatospora sp. NBC_01287]MCX4747445.1 TROVE domain-containing protein [Kitasatospora sp. NBC_01287]